MILVKTILICLLLTLLVAFTTLFERKLLGAIQQRVGPLEIGYRGRLQFIADSVKLIAKGIIILILLAKFDILIVSIFSIFIVYLFWPNLYVGLTCLVVDIEYNFIYIILTSCFLAYSIINIGMISKNKFALIASLRFVLVSLNGELVLGFF